MNRRPLSIGGIASLLSPHYGGREDRSPSPDDELDAPTSEEIVEDYLDHLCAPLLGVVPFRERSYLREENAFIVERLVSDYMLQGFSETDAARKAIAKHGASNAVGDRFLQIWMKHRPKGWFAKHVGLADTAAIACFGLATLIVTALLQMRVFFPEASPLHLDGLTPAQVRHFIPSPLPIPQLTVSSISLAIVCIIFPCVAGWLTGTLVPVQPARAVSRILTFLTIYMFVVGATMLPTIEGILTASFMLVFWLPVGCLCAQLAGDMRWRRRASMTA